MSLVFIFSLVVIVLLVSRMINILHMSFKNKMRHSFPETCLPGDEEKLIAVNDVPNI